MSPAGPTGRPGRPLDGAAGPLLQTKLHVPSPPGTRIARPRLGERFARGGGASLTVVSAPAGFGKSTAVAEWLDSLPAARRGAAWVSLDERQSAAVRRFLLRTSILERLTGGLCDAVTGQDGGRAMLERLERANMFLVPLDDRRRWYRYHHLFADALTAHLLDEAPGEVPDLHRRASAWHAANGDPAEAIRHAFAAGDLTLAADLAEAAAPAWRRDRQEATIRRWLELLPEEVIGNRPVLLIDLIGAQASTGGFTDDAEERLDAAERLVEQAAAGPSTARGEVVVVRQEQMRSLPAAIEMYRAALALTRGELDLTRRHGQRALERAPEDDPLVRAAAAALVGLAAWAGGDLDAACDGYTASIDGLRRAGHLADVLGCSIALADLRLAQGRQRDAMRVYADALDLAAGHGGGAPRGAADMHVGLGDVHRERGELDAAREHLQRSAALGEHNGLPQHPYRSRLALARLRVAEGDVEAALSLLDEAEAVYTTDFSPSIRPIPAVRAALLADHGRLAEALAWARGEGLSAQDELDYLGEYAHVVLARVLLAQHRAERSTPALEDAIGLLERLSAAAESAGRSGDLMPMLVLLALAEEARGHRRAAVAHLARAIERAEPEGYVRVFADEGPRLRPLLRAVAARNPSGGYAARILGAAPPRARRQAAGQPLVDPLSERELDVLRLLAGELTGPEIARELVVSLNTVRTHTKSIYAKLAVTNRRAAVRRAEELNLLPRRTSS